MSVDGSSRAVFAALFANLGIAASKFAAAAVTGSGSMLAEAVHSLADTGNQVLLLVGGRKAQNAPTPVHPFGFGRERYFWSFAVAIVLFTLGGAFALLEGVEKLRHPHAVAATGWALGVLALAIALEALSLRTAVRESNRVRGNATWLQFIRRAKVPELPVVLLEDVGALVGLALALAAVLLTRLTGDTTFDALGTLSIGVLLCTIALVLAREMKSLLIGEAAAPEVEARIAQALRDSPSVRHVIYIRTQHLGPEELLVAAKLEFDGALSMPGLAAAIDAAEAAVRAQVPAARYLFVEPDVKRAAG